MSSQRCVQVAVDAPLKELLTYRVPSDLNFIEEGMSVTVPLGKRKVKGVVWKIDVTPNGEFKLKDIIDSSSERPVLSKSHRQWLEWISSYYLHPIGQVAALTFPPLKQKGRSTANAKKQVIPNIDPSSPPELTEEQKSCIEAIQSVNGYATHLLHGVTGSGKTEVYLHLMHDVLAQGKKALVLVPEISLTPQLLKRFASRFPGQVAVIHSHLTEREKTDQWWKMILGEAQILIGARSALFCPLEPLGIVIMDEEHEPSFKQDEKLRYHARDAAIVRAHTSHCPVVLGSATPSLETWRNCQTQKYHYHQMVHRVSERKMPEIEVVDMREERQKRRDQEGQPLPFWISQSLYDRLLETFQKGEQAALFLNRRGLAQTILCQSCGYVYECPNCAISLTLHAKNHMVCHYCNYTDRLTEQCPQCADGDIHPLGLGTELLEEDMARLFPDIHICRADRDEIQNRSDLEEMISSMESGKTDLLIGTQMIAKGLDFKGLTLVGLVMADVGFSLPDFRAAERSFQLLTQVSGRAGRHSEMPGQVVIQTYNPGHASIRYTQDNDYSGFAHEELSHREELRYPPFGKVASLKIIGLHHDRVVQAAEQLAQRGFVLQSKFPPYKDLQILGPTQAPMAKLRGKFRYLILLKGSSHKMLENFCQQLTYDLKWMPAGTKLQIDMDPMNML
ncbi:MAG: primosomal protein N' [Bdellovibrionales bacterium]|nr:primosomal protein N' [Bdellovibrionales bacterium]